MDEEPAGAGTGWGQKLTDVVVDEVDERLRRALRRGAAGPAGGTEALR